MTVTNSLLTFEIYEQPSADESDSLMLTTAAESYNARPPALIARTQKFYDITPTTLAQDQLDIEINIEQTLAVFDELWQTGEFDETLTEEEYLSLRQAIEDSAP